MIVISIESAPLPVRGELSKWLIELKPGVFVGSVSADIRDRLWDKLEKYPENIDAIMAYSTNNEQGFTMKMQGDPHRSVVDYDGVSMVKIT